MSSIARNNVTIMGRGQQVLLFSHGFGCDQNMWRYITPWFLDKYKIVLFDHVGAGNSDLAAYDKVKYSTLGGYADDVLDICRELNLHDIIFVGHSVGAMIGILSAIREPSYFAKLILIGPSPCYINEQGYIGGFELSDIEAVLKFMDNDYHDWAYTFASLIMGNPYQPAFGTELAESFCNTNPLILKQFARVAFLSDNRTDLAKLQTKCLILQCSEDLIAPIEVGEYMYQALQDATIVYLKATGHCPNLSAPLETTEAIESFLLQEM